MMGVEMAAKETKAKLLTGSLGLIAGALRIAISELVSVYTQVDTVTFQANRDLKRLARDHDHDHERTWQLMVPSPAQVALTSSLAYLLVGTVPLLASGFVEDHNMRQCIAIISASLSMLMVGVIAAVLGRASIAWSCARVLIGGLTAILIMWGKMKALGNAHVVQDVDLCGGKVPEFIEAIPVTPTVEVSRNGKAVSLSDDGSPALLDAWHEYRDSNDSNIFPSVYDESFPIDGKKSAAKVCKDYLHAPRMGSGLNSLVTDSKVDMKKGLSIGSDFSIEQYFYASKCGGGEKTWLETQSNFASG
ncbi:hypothetical protein JRO89_XS06G0181000 [Xanthoceras sorbifolium]|uniref:Uncharacterized protein n=1 Tax=Xanthoceras sorbifolium TaxID=99658 RepID=A0ABQ8HYY7_9ROSI|nr:hypothetical protein JRO89_XS06G0181000 [Xanthoceras sorbifolium]